MKLRDQKKEVESLKGYSKDEISEFKKQIERQLSRITEMVILFISLLIQL